MAANTPQAVKKWNSIATEENRIIGRIGKAGVSMKDLNALQKLLSEQHTLTTKLFSNWMNSAEDKAEYISETFNKDYEKTLNEIIRTELGKTVANVNQLVHDQTTVINMLDGFNNRLTYGFTNLQNTFMGKRDSILSSIGDLLKDSANDLHFYRKRIKEELKEEEKNKAEKEKNLETLITDAVERAVERSVVEAIKKYSFGTNKAVEQAEKQRGVALYDKELAKQQKKVQEENEFREKLNRKHGQKRAWIKRMRPKLDELKEAREHDVLHYERLLHEIKRFSLQNILFGALDFNKKSAKLRFERKLEKELYYKHGIKNKILTASEGQKFVLGERGQNGEYLAPMLGADRSTLATILNLLQYGRLKHKGLNPTIRTKRWGDRYLDKKRRMRENWEKRLGILSKGYGKLRNSISRLGDLLRNPASFIIDMLPKLAAGVFMVGALKLAWKYAEDFLAGKVNSVLDDINSFLPKKWQFSWRMGKGNTKVGDLGKWNHDQDANVKYKTVENRTHHFNSSELMTEPKPYSIQKVYESGKKTMPDANGNIYIGKINGQDTWVDKNGMRFQEDKVDGSNYTSKRYLDSYKNNPSKDSIKIETFDKYGKVIPKLEEKTSKSRSLGKVDTENKLKEEVNQTKVSSDTEIPKGWYSMNPDEAGYVPPKLTYHDDDTGEDYTVNNPDYKPGVNLRKKGDPNARIKTMDGRSYRKVNPTSAQHAKTSRVSQVDPSKAVTINPVEKANSSPKVNKAPMGTAGAMITPSNSRPQPPISVQPLNDF